VGGHLRLSWRPPPVALHPATSEAETTG